MEMIDILAILLLCISAYAFMSHSRRPKDLDLSLQQGGNKAAFDWFFFNKHSENSDNFGMSMAAASTSLATVIFFFITGIEKYGLFLFWCGISYLLGQFIFLRIMKRSSDNTNELSTVSDYWFLSTGGKYTSRAISLISFSALLTMLFLELFIGSQILTFYIEEKTFLSNILAFGFLLFVVVFYVSSGGMGAVFKSDSWQFKLMILSLAFLLISAIFTFLFRTTGTIESDILDKNYDAEVFVFVIWVTIQNFTLPYTQLSSWQRLASTESVTEAQVGLKNVITGFLILWIVPVVALTLFYISGVKFSNVSDFFNFFRLSENLFVYFSFAVLFAGFSSALFSTADSALIASVLSISDRSTFQNRILMAPKAKFKAIAVSGVILISIIQLALFTLLYKQATESFLPIIYTIFSQLAIFFPHIFWVIGVRQKSAGQVLSSSFDLINAIGLIFSWLIFLAISIYGPNYFEISHTMATLTGSLISILFSSLTLVFSRIIEGEVSTSRQGA
ncbi:hypothetical protein [Alteromonas sp. ASW11-130]|uniref:hypothetical protein n=1 Tax=Alteromonas sp. ASW11-130 TaxID=3015775 RepID=UPI0022421D4E|nr:hypothetical protein [Alteromonas sp. ASW11-130]MCW8093388.1 hypothetical protein [Alteromonas sp. ASW11-130]